MSCRSVAVVGLVGLVGLAIAGCATIRQSPAAIATARDQRGPVCDTAVGSATTIDATLARSYADAAMRLQIGELRGDLMAAGLRGVHLAGETNSCGPYALTGPASGLVTCTVKTRVCAN